MLQKKINFLSIVLIVLFVGCKSSPPSILIGKWCLIGVQNEPESEIEILNSSTRVLEIISKNEGYEYYNRLPTIIDTSFVIDKITKSEIIAYERNVPLKKTYSIIYEIVKLDSNELELKIFNYEGYKLFFKRCD